MAKLVTVDLLAGLGAGAWAVASQWVPQLATLVDPMVAGGFAVAALGRWYLNNRKPRRKPDADA